MKKIVLMSVMAMFTLSLIAQDDMYFVPTEKNVEKSTADYGMPKKTYYSGSRRTVDDYNRMALRHGSSVQPIDSVGNDIVDFDAVAGAYPDSVAQEDYRCTRRMSRFDDYDWWDGYYAGRSSSWYWYNPWYSPYWYDSWCWGYPYYGYYSSWYWHDPWYWGGWYGHHYNYHPIYVGGLGGNAGHRINRGFSSNSFRGSRFGGTAAASSRFSGTRGSFGRSRSTGNTRNYGSGTSSNSRQSYSSPSNSFGSSRSSGSFSGGSRSGFSGGSHGGGFSGGSRGGGRR